MNPILAADSIGKRFGRRRVLSSASVWVRAGRITALLGRNGCGKTTLLRIMCGFVHADHGTVVFRGRHRPKPKLHRMASEGLFFLPERDLLSRGRSVYDHIDALVRRFGADADAEVIDAMRLRPLLDMPLEKLSTGERRRAELALTTLRKPSCLIADEPFMGIAPRDAEVVTAALRALAAGGTAVLVTGHEIESLLEVADEVSWMTAGTTHLLGSPADALQHDQFRRDYLGPGRGGLATATPGSSAAASGN